MDSDSNLSPISSVSTDGDFSRNCFNVVFMQKLLAELIGTYFLVFAGSASVVVNMDINRVVTLPGIAIEFGSVLMVMIYSVGHVSGAHFNPSVTIALASCGKFPWMQVPWYILVQILGSILASATIRLLFEGNQDKFAGTLPTGSDLQAFLMEIIITFLFLFVISSLTTDDRANQPLAGLAIGATLTANVMIAGPISGGSVNPARSLGPAIVSSRYEKLWIYLLGPTIGAIGGAWVYVLVGFQAKPSPENVTYRAKLRFKTPCLLKQ
ncbi:nodulin-26-like [Olea europaea var. sylvestris]|uniref:nodulin-26-like n=1 Tax=Olea europaea var. sylvestris TaxID=158386 RepID=UPI000C1CF267|nr:nodulin-26-like [Olea europaea var. sylvestris]